MKYLQNYNMFESNDEINAEKRIRKFFNDNYIIKKSIKLNTKLSVWIINSFLQYLNNDAFKSFNDDDSIINDINNYIKSGKNINENIKLFLLNAWNNFLPKIQYILDWVNSFDYKTSPTENKNITKLSFIDAYTKSENWHNSLIAGGVIENEHGEIIMSFDDGFYWIDLQTTYDRDEANAMGHCGNTNKGNTLYSLRDRKKASHVTASIDQDNGIVYQMKGRNNKKPIDKYHLYIVELLINDKVEYKLKGFSSEYDRDNDFNPDDLSFELLNKLKENRPDIDKQIYTDDEIDEKFKDMLESNYIEDKEYSFNLIEWCYDVDGINSIINNMKSNSSVLFDILCEEFPEKINYNTNHNINNMLMIAAKYIDYDLIANKYNIIFSNQKISPFNKWEEIYNVIGIDEIEKILKDDDILIKYNTKQLKNDLSYDIDKLLYFFFDDEEDIMKNFKILFDPNETNKKHNKYNDVIDDIFELYNLAYHISDKLTIKQKTDELDNYGWL